MQQQKISPARIFLLLSIIISVSAALGFMLAAGKIGKINPPVIIGPAKEEITITTDKTEYEIGEPVEITIANHQSEPIYLSPDENLPDIYSINIFKNGNWERVAIKCGCTPKCDGENLIRCPLVNLQKPYFTEFQSPFKSEWKQTQSSYADRKCGNELYKECVLKQVEAGKYKAGFCYWQGVDITKEVNYALIDKKKCVQSEFTIKDLNIQKNPQTDKNDDLRIKQCVNDLSQKNYDYIPGSIIVSFEEKYTERDISDILTGYNLSVNNYWNLCNCVQVYVQKGTEIEWVCKLNEDGRIKFTELNIKSHGVN